MVRKDLQPNTPTRTSLMARQNGKIPTASEVRLAHAFELRATTSESGKRSQLSFHACSSPNQQRQRHRQRPVCWEQSGHIHDRVASEWYMKGESTELVSDRDQTAASHLRAWPVCRAYLTGHLHRLVLQGRSVLACTRAFQLSTNSK